MNEIKSHEWLLLGQTLVKDGPDTLTKVFDHLIEETERYERGEGYYPKVEFIISLVHDSMPVVTKGATTVARGAPTVAKVTPTVARGATTVARGATTVAQ